MSQQKPKKESTRVNTGNRGSRRVVLSPLQKVLLGGGAFRNVGNPKARKKVSVSEFD